MPEKQRPLWRCPKCGARLITARMWHSCGRYKLSELFARSDPSVKRAFRKLESMVRACGPVTMIPQKTRVVFMTRVRFVAVYPRKRSLEIGIELPERRPDPRFHKIESYTQHMHGHYLRIERAEQLDAQIQLWMRASYRLGAQRPPRPPHRRARIPS